MSSYPGGPSGPGWRSPSRRSAGGPLVLILLGLLLLLGNLHVIAWYRLGHYFARWWPALLILWGIIKLLEHARDRQEGRRAATLGAGGVLLLLALVVCGLIASGVDRLGSNVNWGELDSQEYGGFAKLWGDTYSFNQEVVHDFPSGDSLKVVSERGAVNLTSWDNNQVKIVVAKRLRAHDQAEASQIDASTRVQVLANGSEVLVNANTLGGGDRAVESDLTIYLPRRASVNVATRHGDVSVTQRTGEVQVSNSHGDVSLSDITGDASLSLRSGSLHGAKIEGNLNISGRLDDLYLADIGGSVQVNADVIDALTLAHVARSAAYHSSRTDLELAALPGQLTLESGDLKASQVTGPMRLITRSKDIHLDEVSGDVRVENSNGNLEVKTTRLPLGTLQLSNRNADIRLILPPQAAFRLNANVRRGDIHSDFTGIDISGERGDTRGTGTVGSGGPRLEINDEHGDVQIQKS